MKNSIFCLILAVIGLFGFGCRTERIQTPSPTNANLNSNQTGTLASRPVSNFADSSDSLLKERTEKIQSTLKQNPPVLLLADGLDDKQKLAQELAVKDERFLREVFDDKTKESLFNEIFGVYPMRESDFAGAAANCQVGRCYRVEMYNFARNLTVNAAVDVEAKQVLVVTRIPDTQPDIPHHLTKLAVHIAVNSNETVGALGEKPDENEALMANTKTALNRTRCERSQHLCVAPTFVKGSQAIWAIVDLTDLMLVGIRWTDVGTTGPPVTERSLQNEVLTKQYCETVNKIEKNGWSFDYILTSSDGMRISSVKFKNKLVLHDAKIVDWHVNYSKSENFGYSDAVGCPVFSQAAVVANQPPKTEPISADGKETGFIFQQNFASDGYPTPCNYNYEQTFKFYNDGSFRFAIASVGRGCGNDGTYRPVLRLAFAGDTNNFSEWNGSDWQSWTNEQWKLQDDSAKFTKEGFQYRLADANGAGFYLEPGRGQFGDGGRGDNAYVYVTKRKPDADEGDSDLTTIGPCCNTDYKQGPEKFIEPNADSIANSPLVVWYVPQMKNEDTPGKEYCWAESVVENGVYRVKQYPCYAGPMFRPIQAK
jgi:hypothetical protein